MQAVIDLLRPWESIGKFVTITGAFDTVASADMLIRNIERDCLGRGTDPTSDPDLPGVMESLVSAKANAQTLYDEYQDLRATVEEMAPTVLHYLPPIEPVHDAYEPKERASMVTRAIGELLLVIGIDKKPKRRRRRGSGTKLIPLTTEQAEAMHLVGEHKGNITAAAKAAGKSRQAMKKLYDKASKKLGRIATSKGQPKSRNLSHDERGQVDLEDKNATDCNRV